MEARPQAGCGILVGQVGTVPSSEEVMGPSSEAVEE